jgi:hypothetical protein
VTRRYRLGQIAVAYVLALAGAVTAVSVFLRAGARAIERSITDLA